MKRLIVILAILIFAAPALAATVELKFTWDKNTESDLAGYRVYMSATSGSYVKGTTSPNYLTGVTVTMPSVHPNEVLKQITGTEGQKIYFVLTAYDTTGNESGFSNEVNYTIPDTTSPQPPKGFLATLQRIVTALLEFFKGGFRLG